MEKEKIYHVHAVQCMHMYIPKLTSVCHLRKISNTIISQLILWSNSKDKNSKSELIGNISMNFPYMGCVMCSEDLLLVLFAASSNS